MFILYCSKGSYRLQFFFTNDMTIYVIRLEIEKKKRCSKECLSRDQVKSIYQIIVARS